MFKWVQSKITDFRFLNHFFLQYVARNFNAYKKNQMSYGDTNGSG